MSTKRNKPTVIILCLLFAFAFVLTACNGSGGTSEPATSGSGNSTVNNEHGGYDEERGYYVNMPVDNKEKWPDLKEFRVLVLEETGGATYYSEEIGVDKYDTTDDAIETAVRNRNDLIEENYGVSVVAVYEKEIATRLNNDAMAGVDVPYDAAMPFLPTASSLAQKNALYDLKDFDEYIDLSMPWWDNNATESLSIDGKVFFTTGDISFMQKIVSVAVTFNKTMMKTHFQDYDIYQTVEDGNWTIDEMIRLSKVVTSDSDGENGYSYKDTWGLSGSHGDAAHFYLASGERLVSKDSNDLPTLALGGDRSINVSQKILSVMQDKNTWVINAEDFGVDIAQKWVVSLDVFGENRALFRTSAFSAIKKLRAYENADEFGIVPMPKFDTDQDKYYTPCSAKMAFGVLIPQVVSNPEFSAYMLEVISCEAKNRITDAYYETVLKSRDFGADSDSEKMLDEYIFNNVVYDLGVIFDFGNVYTMYSTLMGENKTDITSMLATNKQVIDTAIADVVAAYQDS